MLANVFRPNINVGDSVTWVDVPDSGVLGEGETFTRTFDAPGDYPYFCSFKGTCMGEGMAGVIYVVDSK